MIIYIHGFGSNSFSTKAQILKKHFGQKNLIVPNLTYIPDLAINTLEQLVEICPNPKLIGASLGGYYAIHLATKFNLKAVLINPAVKPFERLKEAVPQGISYYDNSRYDFKEEYLEQLKNMKVEKPNLSNFLTMLQLGDEVINPKEAIEYFKNGNLIIEENGNHSFVNFESKIQIIKDFLND